MTPQANGVFAIGLILIALNFWLSGQSTTFWNDIAHHANPSNSGTGTPGTNPGSSQGIIGGSGGNPPGTDPGPMILPIP